MEERAFLGRGEVRLTAPLGVRHGKPTAGYGADRGDNWTDGPAGRLLMPPGRFLGNVQSLTITNNVTYPNTPAGTFPRPIVNSIQADLVVHGLGARNLADMCHGIRQGHAGGPANDRIYCGNARLEVGSMLFTDRVIDSAYEVRVASSWTAWQEGVHWSADEFGIRLLQGVSAPPDSHVDISYISNGSAETIEALSSPGLEVGLVFTGWNAASRRPVRADLYCGRLAPAESFDLISESVSVVALKLTLQPVGENNRWYRFTYGDQFHD